MNENTRLLFGKYAQQYFGSSSRVLEIGPDRYPSTFEQLAPHAVWHTLDIRKFGPPTYFAESEYTYPVSDGAYDIVFSSAVIEHVRAVWRWMRELVRICRIGGLVITICPTSWPYHEQPFDCWRIYPEGMKALYAECDLQTLLCEWGSFESGGTRYTIPGRSMNYVKESGLRDVYEKAGIAERSYDTIAIGRKI